MKKNYKNLIIGIEYHILLVSFVSILIFFGMFIKPINNKNNNSTLVTATVLYSEVESTVTIMNEEQINFKLYLEYIINDEIYTDTFFYRCKNLAYIPKTLDLYVDNDNYTVNVTKGFLGISSTTYIIIYITFVIISIIVSIILVSRCKKQHLNYYLNRKSLNSNYFTKPSDDPFSKDNCKYNIDKNDPFEDFYKRGK